MSRMVRQVLAVAIAFPAAALVLSGAALGGCGAPHMRTIDAAKSQLVGQDAEALRQCIGEPVTVEPMDASSAEIWVYSSAQPRGVDGLRLGEPAPGDDAHDDACVFTFAVVAGAIAWVDSENRAGWGFGSITECSELVERCVHRSEI